MAGSTHLLAPILTPAGHQVDTEPFHPEHQGPLSDTGVWQLEEGGDLWLVSRQSSAGVPWPGLGLTPLPHSLGGLGRNIILTTMPAGAKLIAGNKPVSFLTAQQLQQLQQQGQATQVRPSALSGLGLLPSLCARPHCRPLAICPPDALSVHRCASRQSPHPTFSREQPPVPPRPSPPSS